jgi:pimeloyl-ACP methyl ester carboxylesterase
MACQQARLPSKHQKEDDMTTDITPFRIAIPDADLDDLKRRLATTRWTSELPGIGWSRGVPVAYLKELAAYWRDGFDWRAEEAKLNQLSQFTTEIDGQTIHFIHARSPEPEATPLLISHGWPGSVAEFMKIIGPLTNPRAHGGDPRHAFHVVAPSLPGFGFSTPLREAGWHMARTTDAYAELMARLGYDHYGTHGGDIGAGIAGRLASTRAEHVIGVHAASDRSAVTYAGVFLPLPDDLTDAERATVAAMKAETAEGDGYFRLQSTRPQTLAHALADSPAGQLGWIVEKFKEWTYPGAALPEDAVDRDQLLTNVSLYWFTSTGGSSAGFYYEGAHSNTPWTSPSAVPQGLAAFNSHPIIRRLMDPNKTMAHWSDFERGGHFPAMEEPELLVGDIRKFFRGRR